MRGVRLAALIGAALLGIIAVQASAADEPDLAGIGKLPPYKMVRTLEYVQDSIVHGDHAAMDMQSFLLREIDQRLRQSDEATFDDPRNVDAALIYAMSGGNPDTLELLASRDVDGHFDHQLIVALHRYFSGSPEQSLHDLAALQPHYINTAIGPYLTLVTANAAARNEPKKALKLFDWVRLLAPGSILEESALRRSIYLADRLDRPSAGLNYSRDYVLRFIKSPYAGQFASLFVHLVVDNTATVTERNIASIVGRMDPERQTEIYLRIARAADVAGKTELAANAAGRAGAISAGHDPIAATLAGFYGDLANIPTSDVAEARQRIEAIAPSELSARDRALRQAALTVAEAVIQPVTPQSIAQASRAMKAHETVASHSLLPPSRQAITSHPAVHNARVEAATAQAFKAFVAAKRDKIEAIDALLKKGGP